MCQNVNFNKFKPLPSFIFRKRILTEVTTHSSVSSKKFNVQEWVNNWKTQELSLEKRISGVGPRPWYYRQIEIVEFREHRRFSLKNHVWDRRRPNTVKLVVQNLRKSD